MTVPWLPLCAIAQNELKTIVKARNNLEPSHVVKRFLNIARPPKGYFWVELCRLQKWKYWFSG
jgi:hypothetical protein